MSNGVIRIGIGRGVIGVAAMLFGGAASAEYEIYNANDIKLDLELQVIGAQFGQDAPWFGAQHSFLNVSANHWTEFGTEFGGKFESKLWGGTLFGEVTGVYTHSSGDDSSGVTEGLSQESETTLEQGHLGWKTDDTWTGLEKSTIKVDLGRFDYSIGTGMLINDGGSDGGDRGGWYIGMRKTFQNGARISLDSENLDVQVFRMKNNPRRGGPQGEARGVNADYKIGDTGVAIGGTYMRIYPEGNQAEADVYDGRASWNIFGGLTVSGEYAYEDGSKGNLTGKGGYAQAEYAFADVPWNPALTYRYAVFNDEFNPLAYGYTDYGYWFQGEVAGNYPLFNNNLKSNMVRAKVTPTDKLTMNLFYYNFKLDNPTSFAPGVTSDDWGDEVDLTLDWQATDRVYFTVVLAQVNPGNGAEQWTGGNQDWKYAMLLVSFTL
jgi:hypothetical protein